MAGQKIKTSLAFSADITGTCVQRLLSWSTENMDKILKDNSTYRLPEGACNYISGYFSKQKTNKETENLIWNKFTQACLLKAKPGARNQVKWKAFATKVMLTDFKDVQGYEPPKFSEHAV